MKNSVTSSMLAGSMVPRPCATAEKAPLPRAWPPDNKGSSDSSPLLDGRQSGHFAGHENEAITHPEGEEGMRDLRKWTSADARAGRHGPPLSPLPSPGPVLSHIEGSAIASPSPSSTPLTSSQPRCGDPVERWRVALGQASRRLRPPPPTIHEATSHSHSHFQRPTCLPNLRPATARSSVRSAHQVNASLPLSPHLCPDNPHHPADTASLHLEELFTSQPRGARILGKQGPYFLEPTRLARVPGRA